MILWGKDRPVCVCGSSVNEGASLICAEFPGSMSRDLRRMAQKWISLSFLGLVYTPQKGLYLPSNKILGGLYPEASPQMAQNLSNLSYRGKTASPKKEGEIYFCSILRTPTDQPLTNFTFFAILLCIASEQKLGIKMFLVTIAEQGGRLR